MLASTDVLTLLEAVRSLARAVDVEPHFPALRVGLHFGTATSRGDDFFGAAVNIAARTAAHARSTEILCTAAFVLRVPESAQVAFRPIGTVTFKNVQHPITLYAVAEATSGEGPVDPVCRMRVANPVARVERDGTRSFSVPNSAPPLFAADRSCDCSGHNCFRGLVGDKLAPMGRIIIAAAALLSLACSSPTPTPDPTPTAPPAPKEPDPVPVYEPVDYPSGPYGVTTAGQTVADFEWTVMLPGADMPSKMRLADLFDPDGSRGINAILAVEQAEWCGPCRQEAMEFENKVRMTWGPNGVFLLDLLIEDIQKKSDDVSLLAAVNRWRKDFKLTDIGVALDPTFHFYGSGIPVNVIIDPRTMQIVKRYEGSTPAVDTVIASLVSKNKL